LNIDYIQIPATKKKKDTKCESQLSKQNLKKIKTKAWIACLFLQCNCMINIVGEHSRQLYP